MCTSLTSRGSFWCKYVDEYTRAAKSCSLGPMQRRCLPPDALEWLTYSNSTRVWQAYAGMGQAPYTIVVTGVASRQLASYRRY